MEPRERNDTIRTGYARWVPKRKNKEKSAKGEKISPSDQSHQKLCGRALVLLGTKFQIKQHTPEIDRREEHHKRVRWAFKGPN